MLTKNLLRFRRREQFIHPQFLSPRHEGWCELADSLISLFRESVGNTQEEVEERAEELVASSGENVQVARGFLKLLMDRTDFEEPASQEANDFRRSVFEISSKIFCEDAPLTSPEAFAQSVAVTLGNSPEELRQRLYRDLPTQSKALSFHEMSSESLIHRYNCAQIQGLLLTAHSVRIRLPAGNVAGLRRLFKAIRFRQLLARMRKPDADTVEIEVEGPLSLFFQTQKYGLALASFFPTVVAEKKWEMVAVVAPKDNIRLTLKVTDAAGLKVPDSRFTAYIPEEFEAFASRFRDTVTDWTIAPAEEFLQLPGESPCFPDFLLKNSEGKEVFLELFHPWHSGPLRHRLQQLGEMPVPLLIGASRKCIKENQMESEISTSEAFARHGFLFREMPLPDEVARRAQALCRHTTPKMTHFEKSKDEFDSF